MLLYPTATFATIFRVGAASITLRSTASVNNETSACVSATRARSSAAVMPTSPEYTSTSAAAWSFLMTDEGSLRVTRTLGILSIRREGRDGQDSTDVQDAPFPPLLPFL